MLTLFGIPNCDTVRKARKWLDANGLDFAFVDFKKTPPQQETIAAWLQHIPLETLLNKRSTTWRKLNDADKADLDQTQAIALMVANPSLIKRPVLTHDNTAVAGFSETYYQSLL